MFRSLVFTAALAVGLAAGPGSAQDLARRDASSARVSRAAAGGILTSPSTAPRGQIVAEFMQGRGTDARTAATLRPESEARDAGTGLTRVTLTQEVEGLRVHGSYARAVFSAQGELLHLTENIVPVGPAGVLRATVDASQALRAALRELYPNRSFNAAVASRSGNVTSFDAGAFFDRNPTVTAVALPMTDNVLRAGYVVETWSRAENQLHYTVVGGDGRVLDVESRTNADSYRVFVEDPGKDVQTVVNGPGAGNAASPAGWLSGSQTTVNIAGNNVRAYLDLDNNNQPDAGGSAAGSDFLATADLTSQPSTATNRAVAVQNLFYLNNVMHDRLHGLGFTEANGNFQANNFGNGGAGGDAVLAEAQDGGGTDNANFSTPADGSAPRMQMYLWNSLGDHLVEVPGATYPAAGASFGAALTTTGLTGRFKAANDGVAPGLDACTTIPSGQLTGFIAIVDRGTCDFVVKVRNAQNAGAVGVVVVNTSGEDIFAMGGTDRKVRIPSVMIGASDGVALKAATDGNSTTGTLRKNPAPPPMRDGSLDMDIVAHEYCHGLTWRMIGSMSGAMSGAIGEGMSDVCAFMINGDDRIGEYSSSSPGGIRRFPYASDPKTYKSFVGDSVHGDGEIYGATIWKLRTLFSGREELLFEYLVRGMVPTAPGPYMEHMRDGILDAIDLLNRPSRADDCQLVWQAFSSKGIGAGAKATPVLKKGRVTFSITESFSIPANACQ